MIVRMSFVVACLLVSALCAQLPSEGVAPVASTPANVQGKWIYGSVGGITYWERDTGKFAGNGRGSAGIFEFDDAGNYKQFVYIEIRTYGVVSRVWTTHEGKVEFNGSSFTIHPRKGHYKSEYGSRKIDRDMTAEELAAGVARYNWRLETDEQGKEHFIIPFDDGSMFDYRRE